MKHSIKLLLIPLLLLTSGLALAQLPLDALKQLALENNPELKGLEQDYLATLERAKQMKQLPDLNLGASGFISPPETRLGPQLVQVGFRQTLPWPGRLEAEETLQQSRAKVANTTVDEAKLELFYQLEKAYLDLYRIEKNLEIMVHNIHVHSAMENVALIQVESGHGSAAEVMIIQLRREELVTEVEMLRNRKQLYFAEINQLLNRELNTLIELPDTLVPANLFWKKADLLEQIANQNPALKRMEFEQQVARKSLLVNQLESRPDFNVGLDYVLVGNRTDFEPENNGRDIIALRASVILPISKNKYTSKAREEALKVAALEDHKQAAVNQLFAWVDQAYTRHKEALLQLQLTDRQIVIINAAIELLQTEYSTSGDNFEQLLQMHHHLMDLELKRLDAIIDSHLAKAEIERMIN